MDLIHTIFIRLFELLNFNLGGISFFWAAVYVLVFILIWRLF